MFLDTPSADPPVLSLTNDVHPTPPPVPPRPDKNLVRERLLKNDSKENNDEKKENTNKQNSGKPDICEISLQQQAKSRCIPVRQFVLFFLVLL